MTSQEPGSRLTLTAGLLLLVFAGLIASDAAVSAARGDATGADLSFVALVVVVAAVAGRSLHRGARWAWWISLAMAAIGLVLVLPATGRVLFGSSPEPPAGAWRFAFFPLTALDLIALVLVLWLVRNRTRPSR